MKFMKHFKGKHQYKIVMCILSRIKKTEEMKEISSLIFFQNKATDEILNDQVQRTSFFSKLFICKIKITTVMKCLSHYTSKWSTRRNIGLTHQKHLL